MAEKKPKKTDETVDETAETTAPSADEGDAVASAGEPEAAAEAAVDEPDAVEEPAAEAVAAEDVPPADEAMVGVPADEPPAAGADPASEAAAEAGTEPETVEPVAEADEPEPEPEPAASEPEPAAEAAPAPAAEPKRKKKRLPRALRPQRTRPQREQATERKPIVRLPKPEGERGRRNELQGTVVSAAMDKTIVVKVDTIKAHRKYKKVVRRSTKFHAHDEGNEAKAGDVVRIVETRPLSKTKNWRLAEIVEVAK